MSWHNAKKIKFTEIDLSVNSIYTTYVNMNTINDVLPSKYQALFEYCAHVSKLKHC